MTTRKVGVRQRWCRRLTLKEVSFDLRGLASVGPLRSLTLKEVSFDLSTNQPSPRGGAQCLTLKEDELRFLQGS